MANKYFEYVETLGDWNKWTTAVTPYDLPDLPKVPGFDLGEKVETGRMPASTFTRAAMDQVWAVMPREARQLAIDGINAVLSTVGSVINVTVAAIQAAISGIAMAAGIVGPIIDGAFKLADAWVGVIEDIREDNDKARRESRLDDYMGLLERIGPRGWAGGFWLAGTYKRKRGLRKSVHPLGWPPDPKDPGILRLSPEIDEWYKGDCSRGSSDFSGGLDSSCRGYMTIYPLFYPVWGERCFGTNKSKKGMERTFDGGAAVWAKMLAMQGALLGNPIANLQCSGAMLERRVRRMRGIFWSRYFSPSEGAPGGSESGVRMYGGTTEQKEAAEQMGGPVFKIGGFDDNFPAGLKKGLFMTPGGLIGTYNNDGSGSVDHPDLGRFGVWYWPSIYTNSPFGGNFISCRDFNTIVSAAGQFFALRTATLRRRVLSETMVAEFSNMLENQAYPHPTGEGLTSYYPIPESKVRRAIRAIADGADVERPKRMVLEPGVGPGRIPGRTFEVIPAEVIPSGEGAGAIAVLGAAAVAGVLAYLKWGRG